LLKNVSIPSFKTKGIIVENLNDYPIVDSIESYSAKHRGTVGCFLAHKNAIGNLIKFAKENKLKPNDVVMVVEDDVKIDFSFWEHVKTLEFPESADVVFFDIIPKPEFQKHRPQLDSKYLVDKKTNLYYVYDGYPTFYGAYAYAIEMKNLSKIFDCLDKIKIYNDVDQFYYSQFKCYTFGTNMLWFKMKFNSDRV
jgi:GR25 family glycosyltransferase involved in LPS biosynthesis